MTARTILICDDEPEHGRRYREQLVRIQAVVKAFGTANVKCLPLEETLGALKGLQDRRARQRDPDAAPVDLGPSPFDSAAVLVVDYDLFTPPSSAIVSGEDVAYLARCFSQCGYIIGVNQFGDAQFDLRLEAHLDSFADLNIGGSHLGKRGLWEQPWTGFRPWHWPLVPLQVLALERRVRNVYANLGHRILEYLGLTGDPVPPLPRGVTQFLAGAQDSQVTTFRSFVTDSGNGLRGKDKQQDDRVLARVAAARVAKWLERVVLGGQEILVDAPHLISRFPSLAQKREIKAWNRACSFSPSKDLNLKQPLIEEFRFKQKNWLSREAWFWELIRQCEDIEEVRNPWDAERPSWVFCEDASRFHPRAKCRGFIAEVPSQFVQRFVRKHARTDYVPQVRFSL